MATFTITTAQNIDALASKTGGDTYNINGGILTVDQDTRVGLNQNTSATLGPVTVSATLGGILNIDGTLVRLIPYNSGSGNVPAWNTVISQGGASGLLIGVYSSLTVASTATGAAMPASGYIKIKQWNSTPYTAVAGRTVPEINGAVPVVNPDGTPIAGNSSVDYDKIFSYTSTTDVIEYQLESVTVKTKTVTYTDATKAVVESVVWS